MEPIERVHHIFQTIKTLPTAFVDDFCNEILVNIQGSIEARLRDNAICVEDFSNKQFQDLLSCMVILKDDSRKEEYSEHYHRIIRRSLPETCGECLLEKLCHGEPEDEYRRLSTLKHLRAMNLFHKEDIMEMQLLRESFHASQSICHYLMEWNPIALKTLDKHRLTLLQELIEYNYPIETMKMALKAGLKYLVNELGLLYFTTEGNESPYVLLMDENKTKAGWTIIEECLDEVEDFILPVPDRITNLYPFMVAACDQSCPSVDLVYYLLRKDPSVMLQFTPSYYDERGLEEGACMSICTSRKRKMSVIDAIHELFVDPNQMI